MAYTSTAIEASKAAVVGFLVPFIFVMNPIFLIQPGESLLEGMIALLAGLLMVIAVAVGFVGHYFTPLNPLERALLLACALGCLLYLIVLQSYLLLGASIILFIILTLDQVKKWRLTRVAASA